MLDAKTDHVEVDDGEDVLVKKKDPNFALVLVEPTVKGTRIHNPETVIHIFVDRSKGGIILQTIASIASG